MGNDALTGARVLIDLAECLRENSFLLPGHKKILMSALDAWIDSGFALSLDEAFGLRSHGGISPGEAFVRAWRDAEIVNLWKRHTDWRAFSPSAAARAMHLSARQYERIRWPREKNNLGAPSSDPAATWWKILRSGAKIPAAKQLERLFCRYEKSELLAKSGAYDGHSSAL